MKNFKFILMILLGAFIMASCSKDTDNPNLPDDNNLKIEGKWQVKKIDFIEGVRQLNEGEKMPDFGWAPMMMGGIAGYNFTSDEFEKGKLFLFGQNAYPSKEKKFWCWTYTKEAFEVIQVNPEMPPYDFSIRDVVIRENQDNKVIVFTANIKSLDLDSPGMKFIDGKATITIEKTADIDLDKMPELFIKGEKIKEPTTILSQIENKSWLLNKGSKVYDPGFGDQDPALEFAKLIAFNIIKEENKLKFRYSFPMGIVSTKETTWEFDEKTNILSYEKQGSGYAEGLKFDWQTSVKKGDKGIVLVMTIEKVWSDGKEIDLSNVDKDLLVREFEEIKDIEDKDIVNRDNYEIFK